MKRSELVRNQNGAVAIIVGIAIILLLGFAAFAVDLAYVMVVRNELQNIADAAALGATRQLGVIYEGLYYGDLRNYEVNPQILINVARDIALKNAAGGIPIEIRDDDVEIGRWNAYNKTFTPTLIGPDAVRVIVRRDGNKNGPIPTIFGRFLGRNSIDVSAFATAALTAESSINEGGLPIPVGISAEWFKIKGEDGAFCDQYIKFYPTNTIEGCAGWHTFIESPPNASTLRKILNKLRQGTYESPKVSAGLTELEFVGGNLATDFEDLKALFDFCKVQNDPNHYCNDKDTDDNTWTTSVVVYDPSELTNPCSNPNKPLTIVGFATVTILEVATTPEKTILARVRCGAAEEGRGGGAYYGTIGTIPGLVQ